MPELAYPRLADEGVARVLGTESAWPRMYVPNIGSDMVLETLENLVKKEVW
jgi:hypothetical protein